MFLIHGELIIIINEKKSYVGSLFTNPYCLISMNNDKLNDCNKNTRNTLLNIIRLTIESILND